MNRTQRRAAKQSNAEMIYNILRTEKTPRDAAATISAVIAALVWDVEQADPLKAQKLIHEQVEGTLELWKANKQFIESGSVNHS